MEKPEIRQLFLARRKQLDTRMHKMLNYMLLDSLKTLLKDQDVKKVAVFYPIHHEVDVRELDQDFECYYPKMEKGNIVFYKHTGNFIKAPFNTFEPDSTEAIDKQQLDAVVVPGIVFDEKGYRLGYGKGYYDKFLSDYKGLKVGVAMELFMVEQLPHEAYDVAVDIVVTDSRILKEETRCDSVQ